MTHEEKTNPDASESVSADAATPAEAVTQAAPQPAEPSPPAASTPAVTPLADSRPKPEYGEYAPEGWVNPVLQAETASSSGGPGATPKQLDGVPHNLGVKTTGGQQNAPAASATSPATPSESAPDEKPKRSLFGMKGSQNASGQTTAGQTASTQPARPADRIITIALLAIGAYGALNIADAMINLRQVFAQLYAIYDLGSFNPPEWFAVLSSIGGILQLSLWAVTLLLSIQFMRRGRLAFYLPLVAAVLSFIVAIVVMSIALGAAPELMTYLSTNGFNLEDLQ